MRDNFQKKISTMERNKTSTLQCKPTLNPRHLNSQIRCSVLTPPLPCTQKCLATTLPWCQVGKIHISSTRRTRLNINIKWIRIWNIQVLGCTVLPWLFLRTSPNSSNPWDTLNSNNQSTFNKRGDRKCTLHTGWFQTRPLSSSSLLIIHYCPLLINKECLFHKCSTLNKCIIILKWIWPSPNGLLVLLSLPILNTLFNNSSPLATPLEQYFQVINSINNTLNQSACIPQVCIEAFLHNKNSWGQWAWDSWTKIPNRQNLPK